MADTLVAWVHLRLTRLLSNPLVRRMLKNAGYLLSATGITYALSMFQNIFAARLLGVAGLGVLGAITQFTTVVNKLLSFRMGEMVVTYVGRFLEQGDRQRAAAVVKTALLLETLASLVAYALVVRLAPLGARHFAHDLTVTGLFSLYALVVLANLVYETTRGLLQIFDHFRPLAVVNIAQAVVVLGLILLAYVRHGTLLQVVLAYMSGKLIGALGQAVIAFRVAGERLGRRWWNAPLGLLRGHGREIAHFLVSTNLSATLSLINKDSEILWVSFFRGPVEAGYYKQAIALANLVLLPISPLPQATFPEIAREVGRRQWANVREVLRKGSLLAAAYTFPAVLGLALLGRPLIRWLYGAEFLPAYPALLILLLGLLAANTFYWNRAALLALGRPDFPTKVNFGIVVGKIVGVVLLLPRFGYLASAALLSASHLGGTALTVTQTRREIRRQEAQP